jgi:hypothetical protein
MSSVGRPGQTIKVLPYGFQALEMCNGRLEDFARSDAGQLNVEDEI